MYALQIMLGSKHMLEAILTHGFTALIGLAIGVVYWAKSEMDR